jgi:hypothetical protein
MHFKLYEGYVKELNRLDGSTVTLLREPDVSTHRTWKFIRSSLDADREDDNREPAEISAGPKEEPV